MVAGFFMHVGRGVHMDQETDTGNDQQEKGAECIHLEGERNGKLAHLNEIEQVHGFRMSATHFIKEQQADHERSEDHATADNTGEGFTETVPEQAVDQETCKGQSRNEPNQLENCTHKQKAGALIFLINVLTCSGS